ncbi:MAG: right-handed parallel beta-helix repeat-containing protein [Actinomycetota bacterium]
MGSILESEFADDDRRRARGAATVPDPARFTDLPVEDRQPIGDGRAPRPEYRSAPGHDAGYGPVDHVPGPTHRLGDRPQPSPGADDFDDDGYYDDHQGGYVDHRSGYDEWEPEDGASRRWLGGALATVAILALVVAGGVLYASTRGPDVTAAEVENVDQGAIRESLTAAPPAREQTETSIASSSVDTDPNILWVDPVGGSDTSDGQTQATAWGTLQGAMDQLQPGQTLHLLSGDYRELLEPGNSHYILNNGGTADAWVTIKAAPGAAPRVVATNGNAVEIRADYVVFEGIEVVGEGFGPDNPYGWGVLVRGSHHVRITGNRVSQMPVGGIATVEASNVEILYNEVFENSYWGTEQGSGISIWHAVDLGIDAAVDGYHDVIVGNVVYRNENKVYSRFVPNEQVITDGNGIIIDQTDETGYTGRMLVANNVVFDNGGRGVLVNEASRVDVVHNTTYGNGRTEGLLGGKTELSAARSTDVRFLNNLAWSLPGAESMTMKNVSDIVMGGNVFVTDIHTGPDTELDLVITEDPGLVNPGLDPLTNDFRPLSSSLLVGQSIPTSPHVPFDADATERPVSGATVGAYQPMP